MAESRKLVFLLDDFELRSPGQQLLDRFLFGYPVNGTFHRPNNFHVTAHVRKGGSEEIQRRVKDFGLLVMPNLESALAEAQSVVAFGDWRTSLIQHLPRGANCFIYGSLAPDSASARQFLNVAAFRDWAVCAGTAMRTTFHLPPSKSSPGARLQRALIIVQGEFPAAELDGLEGLLALLADRRNATHAIRGITLLQGKDIWSAVGGEFGPLIKSALSRSDTPQGDPVADGRTQDLTVPGRLEGLAKNPRAWLIQFADGLRVCILVLDGVIADYDYALESRSGAISSAQLHRPPPPAEHHYSELTYKVEQFLETGVVPWPIQQSLLTVELLARMRRLQMAPVGSVYK